MPTPKFKRVLVKLSGEVLMGSRVFGISPEMLDYISEEIRSVYDLGIQIALVVGGGNIFRGVAASSYGMDRTSADHIGMLATVINSIALQDVLEKKGVQTRVQTAIRMAAVAEPQNSDYLFFVADCEAEIPGSHVFSTTFEEHLSNVERCR